MRILNKNEQDICLRILNGNGNNNYLGNIIYHKLGGICISVSRKTKYVELICTVESLEGLTNEMSEKIIDYINEISVYILETVNLINILEKEGYIMLLQKTNNITEPYKFGGCITNMPKITNHFADENISELLIKYIDKEIYVTEEFIEFCKHKFIPRDERRFQKQNRNAKIAICVALFAALSNFFFNAWTKFSDGTKIDKEQVETLNSEINLIGNKLDTINKTAKENEKKISTEIKKIKLKK